jgi:ElaB/YqjD/DUF883 family membrane-anchored ribosome-binding protein
MSNEIASNTSDISHASNAVHSATDRAAQALHRAADGVEAYAHRSSESVRSGVHDLQARTRDGLRSARDGAAETAGAYVRSEPAKSLLLAAAAGAMVMVLLGLVTRARHRE